MKNIRRRPKRFPVQANRSGATSSGGGTKVAPRVGSSNFPGNDGGVPIYGYVRGDARLHRLGSVVYPGRVVARWGHVFGQ